MRKGRGVGREERRAKGCLFLLLEDLAMHSSRPRKENRVERCFMTGRIAGVLEREGRLCRRPC